MHGDEGIRFENRVACHLLRQVHWRQDAKGKEVDMHYVRTKDGAEVDFCLSHKAPAGDTLTHLIECKLGDNKPHTALKRFAEQWADAEAVQVVRNLRHDEDHGRVQIRRAATWLQSPDA